MYNVWTERELEQIQKKAKEVANQLTKECSFGFCKAILTKAELIIQSEANNLKFS